MATESVKVTEAVREPGPDGEKVRVTAQLDPAVRLDPQVVVMAKSVAFAPVSAMIEILSDPLPLLVKVIGTGALTVPTFWAGNEIAL